MPCPVVCGLVRSFAMSGGRLLPGCVGDILAGWRSPMVGYQGLPRCVSVFLVCFYSFLGVAWLVRGVRILALGELSAVCVGMTW